MSLHKEIIWARGTSFNVSPRPELPLTSNVFYFVNYPRTQDILCFLFCLQYVPFISANGTSFNVCPRPELPLTSSVFYFVNYGRTQDILCFLFCLCSFYFGKWNLFQCLSKTWVTTDKQWFSFCELCKDTRYFVLFVLPMFLLFWQMEPLSMSLQGLSYHWQAMFFILWIIQGHKIHYAFCFAYNMFLLFQQMEPL